MGLSTDRVIGNDVDEMVCGICTDVVQDAVITPCQHLFCKPCINQWIREGQSVCPIDRTTTTSQSLKPLDRFRARSLNALLVKCTNHLNGCRLMARYEDLAKLIEHETNQCENSKIHQEMVRYKNENVELKNQIAGIKMRCSMGKPKMVI